MTRNADADTLAVYAAEAERYADITGTAARDPCLAAFMDALPAAPLVLDLGCGPGHAAAAMQARGAVVEAVDASAEMVRLARDRYGVTARLAGFSDIRDVARFDGVWASFSLLHAPKADMPGHLARLRRALRPGGVLALGLKTGTGEARDRLGRFYAYYQPDEIGRLLRDAGFAVTGETRGSGTGLDGTEAPWIVVTARG